MKHRRPRGQSHRTLRILFLGWWYRLGQKSRKNRTTFLEKVRGGFKWMLFLSMLFLVNLYIFYFRPGTSVPSLIQASHDHRQQQTFLGAPGISPGATKPKTAIPKFTPLDYSHFREIKLGAKTTLDQALAFAHLPRGKREELLVLLENHMRQDSSYEPTLVFYYDRMEQWIALDFHTDPLHAVRIIPNRWNPSAFFSVDLIEGAYVKKADLIEGTVPESEFLAEALPFTESKALAQLLIDVFAYERDLQTQCRMGDKFQVVVEKIYQGGRFLRYGNVLLARYGNETNPSSLSAVRFATAPREIGYFTEQGRNLIRSWFRSPLMLGTKTPQNWELKDLGPEWHPQKKRVDSFALYPAPPKTLVRAMISGQLQLCPKESNCTWSIVSKEYEVRYLNLTALAPGIRSGQMVGAGQWIGYVNPGAPGKKTSLRVSLWNKKRVINPIAGYSPREASISAALVKNFKEETEKLLVSLSETKSFTQKLSSWLSSIP